MFVLFDADPKAVTFYHLKPCVSCIHVCVVMASVILMLLCRSKGRSDSLWDNEEEVPCL